MNDNDNKRVLGVVLAVLAEVVARVGEPVALLVADLELAGQHVCVNDLVMIGRWRASGARPSNQDMCEVQCVYIRVAGSRPHTGYPFKN